ncbi:MAG: sigma-70 family RNA polymerase sigma factor, partial [Acidobacteria bacterium]|nr:sigma-70 family RNA polymerase sigma factor [Acidobacteriota bacterium]
MSKKVRKEMICQHLGLVQRLAKKFKQRGIPYEDLVQIGSLGLIKAVDRFDPSNGAQFTTFAAPYIIGEIKHHFRDNGWHLKVASRQKKRALQQVKKKIEYL